MKKRILSVFIALCTLFATFPFSVVHAVVEDHEVPFWELDDDPTGVQTDGDFKYTVSSDGATVVDYLGSADALTIPDKLGGRNVIAIGEKAFYESSLGTEGPSSITLPETVTSIGRYAFAWCIDLAEIKLPSSLTEIGEAAFAGSALTSVTIPSGVSVIGKRAFSDCRELASINAASENAYFASEDGILYSKDMTEIICVPSGYAETSVIVPNEVILIGTSAFYGCSSVTSVSLPLGLAVIGDEAFAFCQSLGSLVIPDSVTEIGEWAFAHCTDMASVTIPDRVTSIGEEAFLLCESLTSVTLPTCIAEIGYSTFAGCYNLSNIAIPEGVTAIGDLAFYHCSDLTSVKFPESTVTFGEDIFEDCNSLETVYLYEGSDSESFADSELPDAEKVYIDPFLVFDGFQLREKKYNGLRSIFTSDTLLIDQMEENGLSVVEYGTLMASTAKLGTYGDALTLTHDGGEYVTKSYARKIAVFIDGGLTGVLSESTKELIKYACTITNYTETNYDQEATIRGYAVLSGDDGNEFVVYIDYPNPNYRSLSLKRLANEMANARVIDKETNISYLDVVSFEAQK